MRSKTGVVRRRSHKKVLAATKGYRMTKNRLYKVAYEAYLHAGKYAYIGRRLRKRDFRALWITRIGIAVKNVAATLNYSVFMNQLKKSNIELNRKMLAELAVRDFESFTKVVETAQSAK
jgi:large subunit ribosomal protein L20